MARARNIKPGFYKNEDLAECSVWARYIFPGLWMLADREGRLEDRPKRIKGELLPFDSQDVEPLLTELEQRGFLERYRNDDGSFIQISKFSVHQTPHYSEKKSVIKPPILQESSSHQGGTKPVELREIDHDNCDTIPRGLQENSRKEGVLKRGSQPPDSLNPDSLIPDTGFSDSPNPSKPPSDALRLSAPPEKINGHGESKPAGKSVEVWRAYSAAYEARYGVLPVRNAKVNSQLGRLVDSLGAEDAPAVAEFYVEHNWGLYVSSGHCTDLLLRDCGKLRTEWATGRKVTRLEIKSAEQVDGVRAQIERVGRVLERTEK